MGTKRQKVDDSYSPPLTYEQLYSSFREEWKLRKQIPHLKITSLVDHGGIYLLAGNSFGQIIVCRQQQEQAASAPSLTLLKTIQVSCESISFLHVSKKDNSIIAGGRGGLWMWLKLEDLLSFKFDSTIHQGQKINLVHAQANEKCVYVTTTEQALIVLDRSDLSRISEHGQLFDDLEQTDFPNHAITALYLTSSPSSLLLCGTNCSKILCWDIRKTNSLKPLSLVGNDSQTQLTVTAITSHDDWWTIAGYEKDKSSKSLVTSFVGTWHGPTYKQIKLVKTRETVQGLWSDDRCSDSNSTDTAIYSIANERLITVWNSPYQLDRVNRIWATSPSNKVIIGTSSTKNRIFVGGIGSKIDLVEKNICTESFDILSES